MTTSQPATKNSRPAQKPPLRHSRSGGAGSQKLHDLPIEKPFPSFAGLLDFATNVILPNPRQMPLCVVYKVTRTKG